MAAKKTKTTSEQSSEKFVYEELNDLSEKIKVAKSMPEELTGRLEKMLRRLNRMADTGSYSTEFDSLSQYIDVVTSVPWKTRTKDNLDLSNASKILDKNHHGMQYVKDRVLEYLATLIMHEKKGQNAIGKSPIILFVGLQGVGKTTMAMSMAEVLGRKFMRVSMGALGSATELRGKNKGFAGAEPGQIVKALVRTGVQNPLILLDEIEKASGEKGLLADIMATLLEILDPKQNTSFRDHYVDFPIDLSDVLFVASANNTGTISTALMDRLEVIKMPSYTNEEKEVIAREYVLPQVLEKSGLSPEDLTFEEALWPEIVRPFGYDSGIRSIGRTLESIARKTAREIVEGKSKNVHITSENLKNYLPK